MEARRTIRDVTDTEIELLKLRYITEGDLTIAKLASEALVSFDGLKRLSAAQGWVEDRANFRAEAAQSSHFDTGVGAAESHANLMRAMQAMSKFASDAAQTAVATGDMDDFEAALSAIERVNKQLGAVKGTIGPSASGLSVLSPSGGGGQGGAIAVGGSVPDGDDEALPTNVIRNTKQLVANTVAIMTQQWSQTRQVEADERQAAEAKAAGVIDVPAQAPSPAAPGPVTSAPPPPPPGPTVQVTQTPPPPPTGPPAT